LISLVAPIAQRIEQRISNPLMKVRFLLGVLFNYIKSMNKYTIPYQYTVIAHAAVMANSLEEAVELIDHKAQCPVPQDIIDLDDQIKRINLSYLCESFEIHHEDLDIVNSL